MSKQIILAPSCSGKSYFMVGNDNLWEGNKVICNEWLSSSNYHKKGIHMGSTGAAVPTSHPLYMSWDDMYKIGVDIFYTDYPNGSSLMYNCGAHIPYLRANYSDIDLKIVLIDPTVRLQYFRNKWKNHPHANTPLIELVFKAELGEFKDVANWKFLEEEESLYKQLASQFNVPIYKSFEEALTK